MSHGEADNSGSKSGAVGVGAVRSRGLDGFRLVRSDDGLDDGHKLLQICGLLGSAWVGLVNKGSGDLMDEAGYG